MVADPQTSQQAVDTLRLALDEIELGVVLWTAIFGCGSSIARLDFEGLMRVVVGRRRALSTGKFNSYVKTRASEIRAGLEEPRDIRMDDGHVIRVNCKTLPDGGRMLVYASVTDLVQHDVIARFGGEEFLLLLPETVASDAQEAAERLRRHVERSDLSIATNTIAATVSIGVAPATPNMRTLFDLIKAADHALYVAKNSGRNRVCCADPDAS